MEFVEEMTKATVAGNVGETTWGGAIDPDNPNSNANFLVHGTAMGQVVRDRNHSDKLRKGLDDVELAKSSIDPSTWTGGRSEYLSKEWTLTNPLSTGLVPYDLCFRVAA
jgi:hypothetical protein